MSERIQIKKNKIKVLLIITIIVVGVLFVNYGYKPKKQICPLDYTDQDVYMKDVTSWAVDYYRKNPNTTKEQALKARMDFLLESGCVETDPERRQKQDD